MADTAYEPLIAYMKSQLNDPPDLQTLTLKLDDRLAELLYLSSMTDEAKLQSDLVRPFFEAGAQYDSYLASLPGSSLPATWDESTGLLLSGYVLVMMKDGVIYACSGLKKLTTQLGTVTSESTVYGSEKAFSEDISVNMNALRQSYPVASLHYDMRQIGSVSKTKVAMVYDNQVVDKEVVRLLEERLDQIQIDVLLASAQLERLITSRKFSLFPTLNISQRIDRAVQSLGEGKVVLLVQGTSFCLIAPAVLFDFVASMDDLYQSYWVSLALLTLRYIGIIVTIMLPAAYVAIVSYNPEFFRVQLTLSIAGSREAVPYPSFVEVAVMLFLLESLIEASIRLPKTIASTATTVGGLILGQAAQQAGLVSSIMIIVISTLAIANFVIPINAMSFSLRLVKYPLILLASFFGLIGLIVGLFGFIVYLADLRSFGKPYLKLRFSRLGRPRPGKS
ncbi:spore germination protein [Paenibacillus sp. J31TS4]|uniref:spore germination protein n=1 Tax=Paenibacillus sp. J31TS4 TaxID=2807195 RepID=UPI001B1321B9|nr:spore germination protein [Paenibacillus sp. J31TS4]GIP38106.1 spore germination protein [Paenibacillus sp. J31TS4]